MIKKSGFTLIELLIVVAIIAILAAIAVPNFLEAQVRAKASRAKSDIRTVITGLETYMVDHNKYPVPRYQDPQLKWNTGSVGNSAVQFVSPGIHMFGPRGGPLNPSQLVGGLTSPVAYLTSVPKDPFVTGVFPDLYTDIAYQNMDIWCSADANGGMPVANGEATSPVGVGANTSQPNHFLDTGPTSTGGDLKGKYGSWILRSLGPDKSFNSAQQPYDATNGSVSPGDIYRTHYRTKNNRALGGE